MKPILLLFVFQLTLTSSKSQDCKQMPSNFRTYEQAILFIKKANFKIKDIANTTKSSWIRAASFYSCNGTTGYLIIGTDNKEYVHSSVPITLWNQFKNASSFGNFYDNKIKGKYRFNI